MATALRLYRIPFSTNVERVALALAHKGLEVQSILVDPADRSEVLRVSGQELVPVLLDGETVVCDSTAILEHLEVRFPGPPLYPADPARRAELRLFVDWFDRVWKRPPNLIVAEEQKPEPDRARIAELAVRITGALPVFEDLLAGRDYLFGDSLSAADVAVFPFLKYATLREEGDPDRFHEVLRETQGSTAACRGSRPGSNGSTRSRAPEREESAAGRRPEGNDDGQERDMHPSLNHEIARFRQADLHREAARARLAHEVSVRAVERPRAQPRVQSNLTWLRRHPANRGLGRPLLGH